MDNSFGNWIRRRRKSLDLTQQELAVKVKCSTSLLVKIESDERRPSRQIAELLAIHLEIPADQRNLFLKVARQETAVDSLATLQSLSGPELVSVSSRLQPTLPMPLTSLIGRDLELRAVTQQIQNPSCRLLTLTGLGGVGKTRLALEAAHQLQNSFNHGAWFVSLVGTSAAEFVVPAIADTLEFSFSGAIELKAQLLNFLREKQIFLVLDNLEHLLNGIEVLDELLEYAPGVKLLATSREQLNLRAEWVFEVQGLPVPSAANFQSIESSSATTLFIDRAKQASAKFVFIGDDLPHIAKICELVDGLPLGIELASTWVRTLSCQDIAVEIERNIGFLAAARRDLPERHRSLWAVFDHSWRLLSMEEQRVLRQLTVLRGGFTREAAEQVTGASLSVLSSLVSKSLVRHSEARRYELHELIRQYAATFLHAKSSEEISSNKKHAQYYLTLIQEREPKLRSSLQKETLDELRPDKDNFRAAWDFAVANAELNLLQCSTGPLYYFYELQQYFEEAMTLYKRGAASVKTQIKNRSISSDTPSRATLEVVLGGMLTHQAFFLQRMGRNREAIDLHRASLELLRPHGDSYALTFALVLYGTLSWAVGDLPEAAVHLQDGLRLSRSIELHWLETIALCFSGTTSHDQGKIEEAYELFRKAMALCERMKDPYVTLLISTLFSRTAQKMGRLEEAQGLLVENLRIARESSNRWGIGLGLEQLSANALAMGNPAEARRLLDESTAIYREIGDPWSISRALNLLSQLALAQSDLAEAESCAVMAFKTAREVEYNLNALDALATLAEINAGQGRSSLAFQTALFVLGHLASSQAAKERAGRVQDILGPQLTPPQIKAARSRIRSLTLDTILQVT